MPSKKENLERLGFLFANMSMAVGMDICGLYASINDLDKDDFKSYSKGIKTAVKNKRSSNVKKKTT